MKDTLSIALVQADIAWEDKATNKDAYERLLAAMPMETHVVFFPEMMTTSFSMNATHLAEAMDGVTVNWLRALAQKHRKILCGSVIIVEDGHYFNRLIWMQPDGTHYQYDKAHLFVKANEQEVYTSGRKKLLVRVNGWTLQLQICFDLRFPVWARVQDQPFDVLVNVACWPQTRSTAWEALLQARAIENQCYVLGVNRVGTDGNGVYYNGCSSAYHPVGQQIWRAADYATVGYITLHKSAIASTREKLPFLDSRDKFLLL